MGPPQLTTRADPRKPDIPAFLFGQLAQHRTSRDLARCVNFQYRVCAASPPAPTDTPAFVNPEFTRATPLADRRVHPRTGVRPCGRREPGLRVLRSPDPAGAGGAVLRMSL